MVLKSPQESAGRAIEWILSPSEQETWRLDDIRESRKDHVVKRSLGDPKRESFDLLTVGSYYMNLYIYIYIRNNYIILLHGTSLYADQLGWLTGGQLIGIYGSPMEYLLYIYIYTNPL